MHSIIKFLILKSPPWRTYFMASKQQIHPHENESILALKASSWDAVLSIKKIIQLK